MPPLAEDTLSAPYNPYETAKANTYKVQLHCHSSGSDGDDTPAELVTGYKAAGYHAVAIADHDILTIDPAVADITFIPGCEETVLEGHLGCLNITSRETSADTQTVVNATVDQGGVNTINHPNMTGAAYSWTAAEITALTGVCLIEIYNGFLDENAEDKWTTVLDAGKFYFGCAADDCHNIALPPFNVGWVMVHADANSVADIVASLKAGNFYASQGPTVAVSKSGNDITATTGAAATIEFISDGGAVVQTDTNSTSDTYTLAGTETYIRVRITRDSDGKMAWSNPIWL